MKKFIFLLFIPLFLFAQDVQETEKSVDDHLNEQISIAKEVITNINEEKYLKSFNEKNYDQRINYFLNRIEINQRQSNDYAVKRDELKLISLQEVRQYYATLKEIIEAKKSLKDVGYFKTLIEANINFLEKSALPNYTNIYQNSIGKDSNLAKDIVQNYDELSKQNSQELFTLRYLLDNMEEFRPRNFFIDYCNLDYFIKSIDTNETIYPISQFCSYYLKFSIGEILVVIFIIIFFRILNTRIITLLTSFINRLYEKKRESEGQNIEVYLKKSIERPLILALYTLSIQISIFILVKDTQTINSINPWINTLYMGLLTWTVYSLLSNSITNYAQHLVEQYKNVRKEMIVFILRITKVVLILLVLLFLFSQLGIDIKAIAASLGVGGIAIALASKDTLANFFGSLNIMTDNSFSQGDWIIAGDVEGTVVDIRMRTTRIRTFDNAMITIPNSQLANTHIKNFSKRRIGRRIKMMLGITYESKMEDIVNLKNDLFEMLSNHPNIATEKNETIVKSKKFETIKREDLQGVKRNLLVYIDEYGASSINIMIYCFTKSPKWEEWLTIKEDVLIKIHELVEKNNCEFAYPTQTLHLKNDINSL